MSATKRNRNLKICRNFIYLRYKVAVLLCREIKRNFKTKESRKPVCTNI